MRKHIKYHSNICGGELVFSHKVKKGKHEKFMYRCKKCNDLVNVIINKSYDQMHRYD